MAGFMSGFGNAFASSFREGMAREEERKNDTFKLMYSDYLDRRKQQESTNREVEKNIKYAKTLASDYGLPSEAWQKIYEWKDAGLDDKVIFDNIQNGVWGTAAKTDQAPTPDTAAQVDPRQGTQVASAAADAFPTPMDQQMSATGLSMKPAAAQAPTKVPSPQAQQPAPTNPMQNLPTMKNGLLGSLSGIFDPKKQAEKQRQAGMDRIAQVTGQTPEQIDKTMAGGNVKQVPAFTGTYSRAPSSNTDLTSLQKINATITEAQQKLAANPGDKQAQAQLQAGQGALDNWYKFKEQEQLAIEAGKGGMGFALVDDQGTLVGFSNDRPDANGMAIGPDGKPYKATQVSPEFRKQIFETAEKMQPKIDKYRESARGLNGFLDATMRAYDTVKDEPRVLAGAVNYANSGIIDVAKNIAAGSKLITDMLHANGGDAKLSILQQVNPNAIAGEMQQLEGLINSPSLDPSNKLAAKTALFDAQKTLMVYQYGMAIEQSGRAMTNEDFDRISNIVVSGKDAKTFLENATAAVNPIYNQIRQAGRDISESNMAVSALKSGYNIKRLPQLEVPDYKEEIKEKFPDIFSRLNENELGKYRGKNIGKEAMKKYGGEETPEQNQTQIPVVSSQEQYNQLKSGDTYRDPQGNIRRKK